MKQLPRREVPAAKLVILTHEFAPFRGGAAVYAEELAASIFKTGNPVEVWTPDYGERSTVKEYPFSVVRLSAGGSLKPGHMAQFTREIWVRRRQLQGATVLLLSVGAHMSFMALQALHLVRPGRVLSLLHGSEVLRFARNPFCRWLARRFFRQVDQVATVSQFSKSLIERSGLLPAAQNIIIAPCACSSAAARPVAATNARDNKIRILTLARIDRRKGQLDTARALAALPSDLRSQIIYQIGGRGDIRYLRSIERVCREARFAFEFSGSIEPDRLPALYKECDIYAMTSRALRRSVEGFGITYLEAGFHGKPVVGYRSGGASEAVIDGETGLLAEEGDVTGLTNAFARLISDSELRDRLGRKGREHAARFSWDATARILLTAARMPDSP